MKIELKIIKYTGFIYNKIKHTGVSLAVVGVRHPKCFPYLHKVAFQTSCASHDTLTDVITAVFMFLTNEHRL